MFSETTSLNVGRAVRVAFCAVAITAFAFIGNGCGRNDAPPQGETSTESADVAEPSEGVAFGTEALEPITLRPDYGKIRIDPVHVDGDGAMFLITIDSDEAPRFARAMEDSILEVNDERWPIGRWETLTGKGDRLHGELFFDLGGTVQGTAELKLRGLPDSPRADWKL